MSCSNLTQGFPLDCNDSQGGVEKIFIANGPVDSFTENSGEITEISVGGVSITSADFFEFAVPRQTSSITETPTPQQENGTLFFDQAVTFYLNKMEAQKRNELLLIAQATSMIVVVKDLNGKYWSIGIEKGAYMSGGSNTTGVAYGDRNGYEITLTGLEKEPMYEVDSGIVE